MPLSNTTLATMASYINALPISPPFPQPSPPPSISSQEKPRKTNLDRSISVRSRLDHYSTASITPTMTREDGHQPGPKLPRLTLILGLVASIGGFMFGYESAQISGYFSMKPFASSFGKTISNQQIDSQEYFFPPYRQGTLVANLCIGALFGSLLAAPLADRLGRRLTISSTTLFCIIGKLIQISSTTQWVQFAIGRIITGIGIGALSVVVPMYQSECAPKSLRGLLVGMYCLLLTLGIWTAYMVEWGTRGIASSASWRIPEGLSFIWDLTLGVGILFLPESPRFAYRRGKTEEARMNIARLLGVTPDHELAIKELHAIKLSMEEDALAADTKWYEIFTAPKMLYRTLLGITLGAGQQLTGANYLFYYGTIVFKSAGMADSYVTQIILGTVNVVCTCGGVYVAAKCERRNALIIGAAWSCICFTIYALVGQFALNEQDPSSTPIAGNILIVFSCLFIVAFATTWGPLVWTIVAELYPSKYRAPCMALAMASNWLWNYLISFFTASIVRKIHWWYGMVFAACSLALGVIVYLFVIETKDRSLEEIVIGVNPIKSAKWTHNRPAQDSIGSEDQHRYQEEVKIRSVPI